MMKKLINEIKDVKSRQWLSGLLQSMPAGVLENCRLLYRKKETTIMQVGDMAESAYLLIEGEVKIMNELPNGVVYSFGKLYAPGILGENELLANFPCYRGTVVCETDCKFIYLSKGDFLLWLRKSPEALYQITVEIIKRNASQVSHDRAFLFSTGEDRLAYLLARYYEVKAENDVCILKIPRSQLADEIGFCVKTVDRCIRKIKKSGLINQRGMKITITKEQYLMLQNFNFH